MKSGTVPICALAIALGSTVALAQRGGGKAEANAFPDGPGKELLLSKCFQCHGPSMWMAQRQDRRAWESTLYRMVGRGALWTDDEIRTMAAYLANTYGKKTP
jgi:mono/diheme cytochrome c family protein